MIEPAKILPCGHPFGCEKDWERGSGTYFYEGMPEKQCLWCRDIAGKKNSQESLVMATEEHAQMRQVIKDINKIVLTARAEKNITKLLDIRNRCVAILEDTCDTKLKDK